MALIENPDWSVKPKSKPDTEVQVEFVREAIRKEIEKIVIEEANEAQKRVKMRVRAKAAELAVVLTQQFNITSNGQKLTVEINLQAFDEPK